MTHEESGLIHLIGLVIDTLQEPRIKPHFVQLITNELAQIKEQIKNRDQQHE